MVVYATSLFWLP